MKISITHLKFQNKNGKTWKNRMQPMPLLLLAQAQWQLSQRKEISKRVKEHASDKLRTKLPTILRTLNVSVTGLKKNLGTSQESWLAPITLEATDFLCLVIEEWILSVIYKHLPYQIQSQQSRNIRTKTSKLNLKLTFKNLNSEFILNYFFAY